MPIALIVAEGIELMLLGIEIGGTKLQLGVGPGDGTIVALERSGVDPAAGAAGIRRQILDLVPKLLTGAGLARSDIRAVGIGFGGPVRADLSTVTKSHQIAGWDDFPLGDWSRRELGWPTIVHNDADTAGLAEACFGAGRGYSPVFYVTIGSGIGGGIVIDQRIYRGAGAGAAEFGHLMVPYPSDSAIPSLRELREELPTAPDSPASIESLCSGWAIEKHARRLIEARIATPAVGAEPTRLRSPQADCEQLLTMAGGDIKNVTTELIASAARSGNHFAHDLFVPAIGLLAWALAQVIALLCPRRIVIGGGVSNLGDELLFEPLRQQVARQVFPPFAGCYEIVPAALGEEVVIHGALRLAKERLA